MLNYAVFVFICCTLATVNGNQPCLGAPENGYSFVPSPEGCNMYILCMNGHSYPSQQCPTGFLFNPTKQECSSSTCMDCAQFGIQNLPHPQYCNQYIECTMGQRIFRTCPSGLKFDRNMGYCNVDSDNVCGPSSNTTTSTSTTTTTSTTPSPGGSNPTCKQGDTYHPHPTDCTRFFLCVNSILWEQQCPNNLHWNRLFNMCDEPTLAGCTVNGGQPIYPTLSPPTPF